MESRNGVIAAAIPAPDAVAHIRAKLDFHRTPYLRAQAPAMLAPAERAWLQMGPTKRAPHARLARTDLPRHHRLIVAAPRAGDEPGLRLAVRADVRQGLRMLAG